ncbi:metalloregulator ArsR/SmtB family transcription factor [Pseudoalteromonas sp. Of7M-16]|uniref:metalloregulator ArsR/SmtB family transcription factor n=1 Tax=Pseudoalteromonas sp. Of7M-16 TaxID=2917756 RepID=UPI001EF4C08A|nr:metalloregulator ArsR/SmtB family transcription factor [Pseudoalteromonas sp. Of7M-16]MCG7549333.1 metalloregulator ArsR/SmtB family transcription factor [Pseudoalteromonas sp. Of7M-16]
MKVLFLCTENSARSLMAEVLLKHHGKGKYEVYSAGTKPSGADPRTLAVIEHFGLKSQGLESQHIDEFANMHFDYVITLCASATKECEGRVNGINCLAWDIDEPKTRKCDNPFEKTLQEINEKIQSLLVDNASQKPATVEPMAFYKALSDETRLKALLIIAVEKEACVCELMTALDEPSQPKVSRHLAQLRKVGILSDRKYHQWVFYSLNPTLPEWMKHTITSTVINEPTFIEQELSRLNTMGDRPTRYSNLCS